MEQMEKAISIMLFSLILSIIVSACTEHGKTIPIAKKTTGKTEATGPEIHYESPINIKNTDILLYPLRLTKGDEDSHEREVKSNHWNFIFYNVISGTKELLTRKKIIINSYQIGDSEKGHDNQPTSSDQFIYYDIIDTDNDGDKKLTTKDLNSLYISTLAGKSFIRITPKNCKLSRWTLDHQHDLILIDLIKDSNGDRQYNYTDDIDYFTYNLKTRTLTSVFDQKYKDEVKNLAKNIW